MLPRIRSAVAGLVVAIAAIYPVPTRADRDNAPASLDEATFTKRVLAASPRRAALDARQRAARAAVGVASTLPNPTLSYEREAVPALDNSDDFLRLGWTVDLAGRRGLAAASASAGADAEKLAVDREKFLLEIEARVAYLEAAHARERLARLDGARTLLAGLVDALRSRAKQGDASSYDVDRAALELEGLDDERATATRALEIARLGLGALLGEPATAYDASDPIALPAKPSATSSTSLTPIRPDVDAALARARQADRDRVAAGRSWIPRFEIVVGMLASSSMGGDGVGYVVGLGGDLPVFDRGRAAADRSRAEATRWRSEAGALALEARGETGRAHRELVMRIDQAAAYLAGPAVRAADLQRRAGVAYREGDRPILELLDVHRGARHAALRALELVYEARRAELALRRVSGRLP